MKFRVKQISGSLDNSQYLLTSSYLIDSASFDDRINNITSSGGGISVSNFNTFTSSIHTFTESINNQVDNIFSSQSNYVLTSYYNLYTSSIHNFTSSINAWSSSLVIPNTSSLQTQITNVFVSQSNYTLTSSFISFTQSIHTFTSSINTWSSSIEIPFSSLGSAVDSNIIDNGIHSQRIDFNNISGSGLILFSSSSNALLSVSGGMKLLELIVTGASSTNRSSTNLYILNHQHIPGMGANRYGIYMDISGSANSHGLFINAPSFNGLRYGIKIFQSSSQGSTGGGNIIEYDGNGGGTIFNINTYVSSSSTSYTHKGFRLFLNGQTNNNGNINSGSSTGIEIYVTGSQNNIALNVRRGLSAFLISGSFNPNVIPEPTAIVHIGSASSEYSSLRIEEGQTPPYFPGNLWHSASHLYFNSNGQSYQLDQQATSSSDFYFNNGTFSSNRNANLNGYSIIWESSSLFRITNSSSFSGSIHDFNKGLDFLDFNTTYSVNYRQNIIEGIHLGVNNIIQTSSIYFKIKNNEIDINDNLLFTGSNVFVSESVDFEFKGSDKGIILRSPNGTRYRLTVENDGTLTTTAL